jgi:hypothetical protein
MGTKGGRRRMIFLVVLLTSDVVNPPSHAKCSVNPVNALTALSNRDKSSSTYTPEVSSTGLVIEDVSVIHDAMSLNRVVGCVVTPPT